MNSDEILLRDEIQLNTHTKANTNYCIKAGAGAGKTTLLSKRICKQLVEEEIPIDKFVVITYTNTAAAELYEKISNELNNVIHGSGTPEEINKAKEVLDNLDLMQISTIHSFLFGILREYSFETGVAMDVEMMEEDEESKRREVFFDDWYADHYQEIHQNGLTENDWIINDKDRERDIYQDTFYNIANIRDEMAVAEPSDRDDVRRDLEPIAKELFEDMIALRDNDRDHRPNKSEEYPAPLYSNADKMLAELNDIYDLKDKANLNVTDIKQIKTCYQRYISVMSKSNHIYNDVIKKRVSTFELPAVKQDKYDAIDVATKGRKKDDDPAVLALESDARELLDDMIYIKECNENMHPIIPKVVAEPCDDALKLLERINELEHLFGKTPLEMTDIIAISETYSSFLKISNFYRYLSEIDSYDYPEHKDDASKRLANTIQLQKTLRVIKYTRSIQKAYQNRIDAETHKISNDDILFRAERLLKDPKNINVLDNLRGQYSKIYVDEFQDTTPIQTSIVKMLSSKVGTAADVFDLEENKLFVVGDPKQSIFRFTGAEKSIFESFYDDFSTRKPMADSVNLNYNYRSNKDIVDWVNMYFDGWIKPAEKMETDWIVKTNNTLHGVFKYKELVAQEDTSDVAKVVRLVNRLVDKPYCLIEPNDGGTPRRIKYSDITVIFKYTSNMKSYIEAFSKTMPPIPVSVQGKYNVDDDEILRNYVILLDFFANFKNKAKKIAASQVIFGVDSLKYDLKSAQSELFSIRDNVFRKNRMDSASIAQYLLAREDLYLPKADQPMWKVRQYRIRLHQMIEKCLSDNDGNLSRLVELMYRYLKTKITHEIKLESDTDAVKFINVHKVKGMSEQIVIIADRSNPEKAFEEGFRGNDGKFYPSVSYKTNPAYGDGRQYYPSYLMNEAIKDEADHKSNEDLCCLQYVAATRAKNAVIILPNIKDNVWFNAFDDPENDRINIIEWLTDQENLGVSSGTPAGSVISHDIIVLEDLNIKLSEDNSALTANQLISITPSGLELDMQTGYAKEDTAKPGFTAEERPSNNIFGTVMHRVFELLVERRDLIDASTKDEQVKRAINQSIIESYDDIVTDDKDDRKRYFDFLYEVLTKKGYLDRIIGIVKDAEVYTEYDFSFYVPDDERDKFKSDFKEHLEKNSITIPDGVPIWINGQADLVVKKGNSVTVYDYKSDICRGKPDFEKAMENKYAGQLKLYRYAIGKSFGIKQEDVKTELIHLYLT